MRPGSGISRRIDSAVTDLPLPDSPTMPRLSPGWRSKLTPSTALIIPASVLNCVRRLRTLRTVLANPPNLAARAWVERVAQPVAEEVERHQRERQRDGGRDHHVRRVLDGRYA